MRPPTRGRRALVNGKWIALEVAEEDHGKLWVRSYYACQCEVRLTVDRDRKRKIGLSYQNEDDIHRKARHRAEHDLDVARGLLDALHEVVVNLLAEDDMKPLLDDALFRPGVTYRERLLELAVQTHEAGFGDEVWGD